ncbi:MAG: hypothetical protein KAV41_03425 [Candidatus Pacebacteria bacterium]|nr:hypothetical protein [Candidatus Paceibacterota bacterium]
MITKKMGIKIKMKYKEIASSAIRRRGGIIAIFSTLLFLGGFGICLGVEPQGALASALGLPPWLTSFDALQMTIADAIITLASSVLWVAGILFNYSMSYTLNIATVITQTGVVNIGWEIFRDLSNMVFIFILLIISIGTILGTQSYNAKNLLVKVILVALLINFSLFTTKVIIDASNVLTVGFYNATISSAVTAGGTETPIDKGISSIFAQSLKLHTIYDHTTLKPVAGGNVTLEPKNIWTVCIFGSIFLLVTAFVFFAASILLIKRLVVLMFLMMISPLAFLGMILPATQAHSKKWWQTLFAESFYAPIYMMFTYVVAKGITSPEFRNSIGGGAGSGQSDTFASVLTGSAGEGMSFIILNFILIIGLMLASIIAASKLGATGAGGMIDMGKKLQGWGQGKIGAGTFGAAGRFGRRFVGGGAQRWSETMEKSGWAKKGGFGSKLALKTLRGVGDSSFDIRNTEIGKTMKIGTGIKGGYKTVHDTAKKAEISHAKSLNLKGAELGAYGTNVKNRSIWTSMVTGTTYAGQKQAGEALEKEYIYKTDLKNAKKVLKRENDELSDIRKARTAGLATPAAVDRQRDIVSDADDAVEKIKEKIKKLTEIK